MTRRPLRIAFIGGRGVGGAYSGIETYYEEIGSRLSARGHEVTAYCRSYFTPDVPTYRGVRVRRLPSLRSKHLETLSHSILCTLDSLRGDYDIIQFHAIGSAPLALIPRLLGRTTLVSVRGLDWQRAKWGAVARTVLRFGERASASCPTATVVVSRTLQQHYVQAHRRVPYCIPNAVPPCVRRAPDRMRALGLEPERFLLFAGRLSPEKGVHTLLEAMRPMAGRMTVALAGGTSYSNEYIESLRRAAWPDVRFLGSVDRETMSELYTNCYAYVLPSAMEGLSVGLLEALGFGTCIVTTDIPENLEVVGSAALTFRHGDVAGLRDRLQLLLDRPDVVRDYRRRAAERALTQPDWDATARRTEDLYYLLVDGASDDATALLDDQELTPSAMAGGRR